MKKIALCFLLLPCSAFAQSTQKTVAVPYELLNTIYGYLSDRPYKEVYKLMIPIEQAVKEQARTDAEKDTPKPP